MTKDSSLCYNRLIDNRPKYYLHDIDHPRLLMEIDNTWYEYTWISGFRHIHTVPTIQVRPISGSFFDHFYEPIISKVNRIYCFSQILDEELNIDMINRSIKDKI